MKTNRLHRLFHSTLRIILASCFLLLIMGVKSCKRAPQASFTATPVTGVAPLQVQMDASGSKDSDGTITSYSWDFGDGKQGSGVTTTNTYINAGQFKITLTVTDNDGKKGTASKTITVTKANQPPTAAFTVTPSTGEAPLTVNLDATASKDADGSITSYQWDFGDGKSGNGVVITHTFVSAGEYSLKLTITDNDAAKDDTTQVLKVTGLALPPDPSTVAPPVDQTVTTDFASATEFLYTGPNPIQTGVAPGTIEKTRVAVLRGKVMKRDNTPLSGVEITILNHPEFGKTLSRADGMFDIAVNGGSIITCVYKKEGFLPGQRHENVPWKDYMWMDEMILIPLDSNVTQIDLTAPIPMQVARGGISNDDDGKRQPTLLIPQGTTAEVVMADGSSNPINNLQIRATEYTVGKNGPVTMPASLPPTSGYTYAVELSVDEAVQNGTKVNGKDVLLNQPIYHYVENFLNFPVGTIVPVGYYDNDQAAWVPSQNGLVIKINSITGGLANLELDTNRVAATPAQYAAFNIKNEERQRLAGLYSVGQSLWRMPITHFSTWDANWTHRQPDDAPPPPFLPNPDPRPVPDTPNPGFKCSSIIEIQNQILGEVVELTGTPLNLHYQSDKVLGRKMPSSLEIMLSGPKIPASLKRIDLEIYIAGRQLFKSFPAALNQKYYFVWDGLDAYGRSLQGSQQATIKVGYVYQTVYNTPFPNQEFAFAFPYGSVTDIPGRDEIVIWQEWQSIMSKWDARGLQLGGWNLDVHHIYDVQAKTVFLGNGKRQNANFLNYDIITTVAGGGTAGFGKDSVQSTQAQLLFPKDVAAGPDGSLFIADKDNHRIRRVDPNGIIYTVAGIGIVVGSAGESGDGGPATQAQILPPSGIALGKDGSLYIASVFSQRIRRVSPGADGNVTGAADEIITTVAGTGAPGYSGDGGPATQAELNSPVDVAVGPDGSLYILDAANAVVRKVEPHGIIRTVAGSGQPAKFSGDGGPAIHAKLQNPTAIDLGPDGSLYIVDTGNGRVRRVEPNGIITTIVGDELRCENPVPLPCGDGGHATRAHLHDPSGIAVGQDGSLFVSDRGGHRIRKVFPDGTITTLVGGDSSIVSGFRFVGDGGLALKAGLDSPEGIALGPTGELYIADSQNMRIRKVTSPFPQASTGDIIIADTDGEEIYIFSSEGRHKKTIHPLTGATLYQFTYDSSSRLIKVTDGHGNVTTIQRDAAGTPTSIVGPYGHVTTLTLNSDGYLSSVTNPAGEMHTFGYGNDGLLTSFTNPRGFTTNFKYDPLGRLIREDDAASSFFTLDRTGADSSYVVKVTSSMGRVSSYQIENLLIGGIRQTNTLPSGLRTESFESTDGTTTSNSPDGTTQETIVGSDPRWGMIAPVINAASFSTSGGLKNSLSSTRVVILADPNDPFSVSELSDTTTINGRSYTSIYDGLNRKTTHTSPTGRKSTVTTDSLGRLIQLQVDGFHPTNLAYNNRGRLETITQGSGAEMRKTAFAYTGKGYLQSITNPLNQTVVFEHDSVGRVVKQTMPDGRVIGYGYDANSNLTSLTPPGKPGHTFSYSPIDLVTQYTPPDMVTGPDETRYTYNSDRELIMVTRPDGKTIELDYSEGGSCNCGRLSSLTIPRGKFDYTYNVTTGNLEAIAAPGGIGLSYTYDGALLIGKTWTGPVQGTVNYAYDNNFRPVAIGLSGSDTIHYQYDNDGLLSQAGALTLHRNAQNGLLTGSTLGNVTDNLTYNNFGELESYKAMHNGTPFYEYRFMRDKLGRITQKVETINGTADTLNYDYDLAGRLIEVRKNSLRIVSYTYDDNGNRLTFTDANGTINGTYDDQDRLLRYGNATYTYSANGELQSKTDGGNTTTYHYDELGNLTTVSLPDGRQITYLIDGQNRRIGKKVNGVLVQGFLYEDDLRPIAELDGNGTIVSRFVYATHVNVPDYIIKGGMIYRVITDHLGSPLLLVNTNTGQVVQQIKYDAFGNISVNTALSFQPFSFAGGLQDIDTKLLRFSARDYDAKSGKWATKDPVGLQKNDPNLYAYVSNNPINRKDPSGLGDLPGNWDNGNVTNKSGRPIVVVDMDNNKCEVLQPDGGTTDPNEDFDFIIDNGNISKVGPNNVVVNPDGGLTRTGVDWIPGNNPRPATSAEAEGVRNVCK